MAVIHTRFASVGKASVDINLVADDESFVVGISPASYPHLYVFFIGFCCGTFHCELQSADIAFSA